MLRGHYRPTHHPVPNHPDVQSPNQRTTSPASWFPQYAFAEQKQLVNQRELVRTRSLQGCRFSKCQGCAGSDRHRGQPNLKANTRAVQDYRTGQAKRRTFAPAKVRLFVFFYLFASVYFWFDRAPNIRISEIQKAEYGCTEFLAQFRRFLIAANDLDFSQTANESKLDEIRRAQVFRILGLVNLLEAAQVTLTNVEKSLQDKSKDFTGADILMSMGAREKMWPKLKLSIDFSIVDKPHVYSLEARVPNMRKENFQVVSNNRSLVVTATRFPNEDDVRQLYKKVLLRSRERHETLTAHTEASMMLMLADGDFGTYKKSFSLPPNVDLSRVDVSFENGRLAIAMPRLTRAKSERPSSPAWSNSSANFRVPELNHSASERGQYHFYSDLSARSGSSNPFTRSPRPTKTNPPASPSSSSSSPSTPNGQTHSRWSFFKKPRVTVEPPPDTPPASSNNSNGGSHSLSGITPIDLGKVQNNLEDNGNNI
eukprot:c20494_g1_i2.p1 GENE.c20494_g1_i2~~c20494_g1_i2.p1  ORF type:complete len:482 (-),score=83.85 c20494_g1_i2:1697-3142(-)